MDKARLTLSTAEEKKLPSNIEAEQSLIGSVLVNNDIIDEATKNNPSNRLTLTSDISGSIVALSHPGADWITGNVIMVDGGEELT